MQSCTHFRYSIDFRTSKLACAFGTRPSSSRFLYSVYFLSICPFQFSILPIQARRQGGGGALGAIAPPTGRKGPPRKNLFGWKTWTCAWKNAKDEPFSSDLSLYPVFVPAVDHLELCSWIYLPRPTDSRIWHSRNYWQSYLTGSRNYERTGFIHPNSPIRHCSNDCFWQSIIKNQFWTLTVVFAQYMWLSHPNNTAVRKSTCTVSITSRFAPTNDSTVYCSLLVKLAFVPLLSGNIQVYEGVRSTFRAVNTIMRKGRGHHFV